MLWKTNEAKYMEMAKTQTNTEGLRRLWAERDCLEEACKMVDNAFDWLVENGYLFTNTYNRWNGGMQIRYYGVTEKGWKVAPVYIKIAKANGYM